MGIGTQTGTRGSPGTARAARGRTDLDKPFHIALHLSGDQPARRLRPTRSPARGGGAADPRGIHATASTLLTASSEGGGVVDLTHAERDEILTVLDDPPSGLEELCRVLRVERVAEQTNVEEQRGVGALDTVPATG